MTTSGEVILTATEAAAVLDLLRVMPDYIDLNAKQCILAETIKRKIRKAG